MFVAHHLRPARGLRPAILPALAFGFCLLTGGALPGAGGAAFSASSAGQTALQKLVIDTASGPHQFSVELMRTGPELEKGLMFRKFLPEDRGMLFDFQAEKPIMMWMKNTYLPLDMIFISKTGKVTSITEHAEPMSEAIISSNGPVYGVLEVNAGTAAEIGLKIGDRVEHPIFKQ